MLGGERKMAGQNDVDFPAVLTQVTDYAAADPVLSPDRYTRYDDLAVARL